MRRFFCVIGRRHPPLELPGHNLANVARAAVERSRISAACWLRSSIRVVASAAQELCRARRGRPLEPHAFSSKDHKASQDNFALLRDASATFTTRGLL